MLSHEAVEIIGEAGTGEEAIERAAAAQPDLVLLDMKLPDLDGLVVLRRLREIAPAASVLIISMHDDPLLVRRAVQGGAAGYVLKGLSRRELLAAVHAVRDGESVLDPTLLRAVLAETASNQPPGRSTGAGAPELLTPLELDVLRLMADGMTNGQISERMHWSVSTTKKYVQRILEKLDVSDRTQAAVVAVRRGLLR